MSAVDNDDDDPRRERWFTMVVLAYPGLPDEKIVEEITDLVSDPRLAFTVELVEAVS